MTKPFRLLREQMRPERRTRAEQKTKRMLERMEKNKVSAETNPDEFEFCLPEMLPEIRWRYDLVEAMLKRRGILKTPAETLALSKKDARFFVKELLKTQNKPKKRKRRNA